MDQGARSRLNPLGLQGAGAGGTTPVINAVTATIKISSKNFG